MSDKVQIVLKILHEAGEELSADDVARKMRHVLCPRWLPGVLEYLVQINLAARIEHKVLQPRYRAKALATRPGAVGEKE